MLYGLVARVGRAVAEGPARSPASRLDYIGGVHEKPSSGPQDEFPAPAAPLRFRSSGTVLTGACTRQGAADAFLPLRITRRALQVMRGR